MKKYVNENVNRIVARAIGSVLVAMTTFVVLGSSKSISCNKMSMCNPDGEIIATRDGENIEVRNQEQWDAIQQQIKALETGNYALTTDGQLIEKSKLSTTPVNPSTPDPNKEFDNIVNLPVGDEYDNACKELKEKDEAQFDKFLDYQQDKALACEHDFIEMSRGSASCIERGFISYECSKCHLLKTDDIESLGHTYKVVEDVAATCTADGYKKSVCEVCGEELLENEVKAAGHTEVTEEAPAGLFRNGSCVVKCSTCGEIIKNEIIPQIIPVWAAIVGGILIIGIAVFTTLSIRKKK